MINSFRRMRTGKPDGSGGSCSGCSEASAAKRHGAARKSEARKSEARKSEARKSEARRLSSHGERRAEAKPPPQQEPAAGLNFEMLIVVNNKFVDELAFVRFVFKNLGGTL